MTVNKQNYPKYMDRMVDSLNILRCFNELNTKIQHREMTVKMFYKASGRENSGCKRVLIGEI
jgi:hypothetical protein